MAPAIVPQRAGSGFALISARDVEIKRIYDPPARSDGFRVLIDRLWPRGVSKPRARLDAWLPELAPSAELRRWFGHDPARWNEFRRRYRAELAKSATLVSSLRDRALDGRVTLLYAARDPAVNHALVLRNFIRAA
jgi:uncharacterized protein YeaO (DUF488 family)